MKKIILFSSLIIASGLLFVNIYTSLVDARSWGSDIPASISTARDYFKSTNPGDFFRVFSPVNQLVALVALILFWKPFPKVRKYLALAFVLYVIGDIFTFTFFYPRNDIMFRTAAMSDTGALTTAWSEWNSMNWVRSGIILAGIVFSCLGLHKIESKL